MWGKKLTEQEENLHVSYKISLACVSGNDVVEWKTVFLRREKGISHESTFIS